MKKLLFTLSMFLFTTINAVLFAEEVKPLYKLPDKKPVNINNSVIEEDVFLVGSDEGLFKVTNGNTSIPLWKESRVDQIIPVNFSNEKGVFEPGWILRTKKGIFYTKDLEKFQERNKGLPFLTIKKYENKEKTLVKEIQELKDISVNPLNNKEMVTATKDSVYYTKNGGLNWVNLGSPDVSSTSIKSVAVATLGGQSVVFLAHSILGVAYKYPELSNAVWNKVSAGFELMPSITSPDEIADILPVVRTRSDGSCFTEIYMSQSFAPIIYRFNWDKKRAELIYKGDSPVDSFDGLTVIDNVLLYTKLEGFGSLDLNTLESPGVPVQEAKWHKAFASVPGMVNTAWVPGSRSGFGKGVTLSELWLLYPGTINTTYGEMALGRKSIYISAGKCITQEGIDSFRKIVKDRDMNSIVIDMKDDYGLLRYDAKDPLVLEKGTVSNYAIPDLNHLISEFKKDGIYLIARIPVFKDKMLSKYAGGKYAVWDKKTKAPWMGIRGYEDVKDEEGNPTGEKNTVFYDEHWVDPYSEDVWEYNIAIAKELVARGFDEIQFDYIRFPTDGLNLYNASYRWRDEAMDKESALISFLSYARENINAPIGIDIYGANGWYRSGARTGQDSEMLSEYVDVIGPMFYPSHFEDGFLYYEPVKDRTYRIYYYGSLRNTIMCRNRAVIRPWVQSFYLGSSWYDRHFYDNSGYVEKQLYGVRDSLDRGYMCWNNSGNYGTTPPDIKPEDVFPGTTPEAFYKKKPGIGEKRKPLTVDKEVDVSILDSILYPNYDENKPFTPFLQVLP